MVGILNITKNDSKCIIRLRVEKSINDTHRLRLVFHLVQYRNGWLVASDLFHVFTQSIKPYTFRHQYRCLNVIHQTDSKNGWLLLSASLRQNLGSFLY